MNRDKNSSHIIAGGVSAVMASLITQPLDVLKTNLIGSRNNSISTSATSSNKIKSLRSGGSSGALSFMLSIYEREGLKGLWRGVVPSFWRYLPGGAIYFGSIHYLKNSILNNNNGIPQVVNNFLIGAISKSVSTFFTMPIMVIKTRFESVQVYSNQSIIQTLKSIYKQEGLRGLYTGLTPTILRDVPYNGLFYLFYRQSNEILYSMIGNDEKQNLLGITALSSVIAGAGATLMTHPFDLIRTRLQLPNQGGYKGFIDALVCIPKEEGLKTLFLRGIVPKIIKRGIGNAISWTLYESTVKLLTSEKSKEVNSL
ncbi:hypothetical protein ABK040_005938 [Willaertia magna]